MAVSELPVPVAVANERPAVQWGPIVLGGLGASAISIVLLAFGSGIGLSAVSAHPYAGASAKALAVISGIYVLITAVVSFALGGYVAGRLRVPREDLADERNFRDGAQGFGVWAVSVVVAGLLAASGAAGALKTVAQMTAAVGAGGAAGALSNPGQGNPATAPGGVALNPTAFAIDRLLAPAGTPGGAAAAGQPTPLTTPATPQMTRADATAPVTRIFATSIKDGQLAARDRTMLVQIVMQQTGLPQADAEKRVDETYAELKAAEQKVRDAAEQARKAALIASFGAAATLLIACAAACVGAAAGAHHRDERIVVRAFGSSRFW
jgi:hypothetical protein